jgi:hypothetical protein
MKQIIEKFWYLAVSVLENKGQKPVKQNIVSAVSFEIASETGKKQHRGDYP